MEIITPAYHDEARLQDLHDRIDKGETLSHEEWFEVKDFIDEEIEINLEPPADGNTIKFARVIELMKKKHK